MPHHIILLPSFVHVCPTHLKEEEDFLASKRYISEKFFNMRISHPDAPGLHGAGLMWQGAADKAAGVGSGDLGKDARVVRDGMHKIRRQTPRVLLLVILISTANHLKSTICVHASPFVHGFYPAFGTSCCRSFLVCE